MYVCIIDNVVPGIASILEVDVPRVVVLHNSREGILPVRVVGYQYP